jgi:hypothetical protein
MTRRDSDATEYEWLAFLYISDEMSVEERDRFEEHLERNLSAQDALARTVGLTSRILTARSTPKLKSRTTRQQGNRAVLLVASLCLASLVMILPPSFPPAAGPESLSQLPVDLLTDQRVGKLVNLWSTGGTEDRSWELTDLTVLENDTNDLLLSDDLNVPGWLMTAISAGEVGPALEMK